MAPLELTFLFILAVLAVAVVVTTILRRRKRRRQADVAKAAAALDPDSRRAAYILACVTVLCDLEVHDEELLVLGKIADAFEIPEAEAQATFDEIELIGNLISLTGDGEVRLDGSGLKLDVYPIWSRVVQALPGPLRDGAGAFSPRLHQISSVYAAGSTIVAATRVGEPNNFGNIGLIRSTDGGANWTLVSGNSSTSADACGPYSMVAAVMNTIMIAKTSGRLACAGSAPAG